MARSRPVRHPAPSRTVRPWLVVGLPVAGIIGFIALWWLAVELFDIQAYLLPAPSAVAEAFQRMPDYLLDNTLVTLKEVVIGFAVATLVGLTAGVVLASSRVVEQAASPVLVALNAIPKAALAPLLLVWLGFGQAPKIVMVVLMCFFPIMLSAISGITSTAADLVEMCRSFSARRWQIFIKVRLPAALPQIFVGLKTAMPLAVIGAVIGELIGADSGLGYVIQNATSDTPLAFAAITLLAVLSVVLFYAVAYVERLLLPWQRETTTR